MMHAAWDLLSPALVHRDPKCILLAVNFRIRRMENWRLVVIVSLNLYVCQNDIFAVGMGQDRIAGVWCVVWQSYCHTRCFARRSEIYVR